MKILVVEDNIKLLKSIIDELNNHFETESCSDGEEALYHGPERYFQDGAQHPGLEAAGGVQAVGFDFLTVRGGYDEVEQRHSFGKGRSQGGAPYAHWFEAQFSEYQYPVEGDVGDDHH